MLILWTQNINKQTHKQNPKRKKTTKQNPSWPFQIFFLEFVLVIEDLFPNGWE